MCIPKTEKEGRIWQLETNGGTSKCWDENTTREPHPNVDVEDLTRIQRDHLQGKSCFRTRVALMKQKSYVVFKIVSVQLPINQPIATGIKV